MYVSIDAAMATEFSQPCFSKFALFLYTGFFFYFYLLNYSITVNLVIFYEICYVITVDVIQPF